MALEGPAKRCQAAAPGCLEGWRGSFSGFSSRTSGHRPQDGPADTAVEKNPTEDEEGAPPAQVLQEVAGEQRPERDAQGDAHRGQCVGQRPPADEVEAQHDDGRLEAKAQAQACVWKGESSSKVFWGLPAVPAGARGCVPHLPCRPSLLDQIHLQVPRD